MTRSPLIWIGLGGVTAEEIEMHGQPFSAEFTLPPLSASVFVV